LIGVENLAGVPEGLDLPHQFLEAFFFSSQTITTLGYGRVAPVGIFANTFAALESMIGLMVFALATGLLYGRFSRPDAKLLYSEHAVIAPYQDINALMFRLINKRRNQLIELEIDVTIGFFDVATQKRSFARLELERNKINLFPLSWTIVHPINEASPFWKKSPDDFAKMKLEVIVLLKGFDDTFSQTIYSRTSYTNSEIVWGKKFLPMFSSREDGRAEVDLRKINLMENAPLNT
jgi:inward rectifier potassium channel